MIVRCFFEYGFKLLVSNSNFIIEYLIFILNTKENMSFSLSNALERPPTRAPSGKHGCMLAGSLDFPPTETNPTPARSSTSSVSALPSSARLLWSVTCMWRSLRRTTRAKRARPFVANACGCPGVRTYGCVGDWHAFVRQESCKHASYSRRFKAAARRQTPRIH